MTDTDYDRFIDAVSCEFEQHLQRLFPDDYGLQRIAWDAWSDFRHTKTQSGPMRDRNGRPIKAAKLEQLRFPGGQIPDDLFDQMEMLPADEDAVPGLDLSELQVSHEKVAEIRERMADQEWDTIEDVVMVPRDATPKFTPSPEGGWVGLQAIESVSILGKHNGVLDDDLFDILFKTETKQ